MIQRGFTVVELIITITVMGILLLLTVVNLTSSQLSARDSERVADIDTIKSLLENYYTAGSPITGGVGSYPSMSITDPNTLKANLPDADLKSFTAPGMAGPSATFTAANNTVQNVSAIDPQPTINQYIYQPLDSVGELCVGQPDCRKFNLYYRLEKDNTVYMVTSKNQ